MPVRRNDTGAPADAGAPSHEAVLLSLTLWPHRSLPLSGFAATIALAAAFMAVPLLALLGTLALWGVLPFLGLALWGLWYFIRRNYADAALHEELRLSAGRISLTRHNPRGPDQHWQANPYWASVHLRHDGGPVPEYLTLKGGGREVELGAFLSPEERVALFDEVQRALSRLPQRGWTVPASEC
jgi:uncharacterized membrane protein